MVCDFLTGREPHTRKRFRVSDEFTKRANAVSTTRYVRVQAYVHDEARLSRFSIEHVQFFNKNVTIFCRRVATTGQQREVIDLV